MTTEERLAHLELRLEIAEQFIHKIGEQLPIMEHAVNQMGAALLPIAEQFGEQIAHSQQSVATMLQQAQTLTQTVEDFTRAVGERFGEDSADWWKHGDGDDVNRNVE